MQPGLVSIMMPAYNAEAFIGQSIESVLAQTYSKWELVIVNDGSKDSTASIVTQYKDDRIKLIHQENGGEASARNTALNHMNGEFLAYLDADDLYQPQHLELTINYLNCRPNVDGVYTDGNYCDTNGNILETLSKQRRGPFEGYIFEQLVRESDVFGPPVCVVLRRTHVVNHDLKYDTDIVIGPDWDFFIRYAALTKFGYIDQSTIFYRVHQTNITVKTGLEKRKLSLARCRTKAIKMSLFNTCSLPIRYAVFFELLIELLNNYPERQAEIIQWSEFEDLPPQYQSKLLRLMARKAIQTNNIHMYITEWLKMAQNITPQDLRTNLFAYIYKYNPKFCRFLVQVKDSMTLKTHTISPFETVQ